MNARPRKSPFSTGSTACGAGSLLSLTAIRLLTVKGMFVFLTSSRTGKPRRFNGRLNAGGSTVGVDHAGLECFGELCLRPDHLETQLIAHRIESDTLEG